MVSFWMFTKCINAVLEGVSEKKIKMIFEEFEGLQSEKGEADTSVFLRILLNNNRVEAMKKK